MKNRKLKKGVVYIIYALSFVMIIGAIYLLDVSNAPSSNLEEDISYVNDIILDDTLPVVHTSEVIIKPFLDSTVTVARGFYEASGSEEEQQSSLIYYEGTYIPNSGIDYKANEKFDVVSILDGTVTKIVENNLLGKIVEVTHSNSLVSVYQSLGEVLVVEGDMVIQGQIIGTTGEANISTELGNHLHFEIISNGENVNPEDCYNKTVGQI